MNNQKLAELEVEFNKYYALAQEARRNNDFYNLVIYLRKAAQCQMDMIEYAPPEKKGPLMSRGRDLLDKAKMWEETHPECFGNTNQSSGGSSSGTSTVKGVKKTNTRFDDVIGCEDVKAFVTKQYIKRFSEKYKAVFDQGRGGSLERGILLFGLPGTGKTMIARAIATEVNAVEFMSLKASDFKDRFYGETEKKIRSVYEEAARKAEEGNGITIIFIDEIETLLPSRSSNVQNYESSAVTEFLTVLDGFEKEKMGKVITIAASNYPNRIDSAAIRPGRLGAWFRVDIPDASLREMLIKKHFANGYTFAPGALNSAVEKTRGFSGADVVAVCDRIKSALSDYGIDAVDNGYDNDRVIAASSNITEKVIDEVLSINNSSISQSSIMELAQFENNYNFKSRNGTILEFMKNLK